MESANSSGKPRIDVSALYETYRRRTHVAPASESDAAKVYAENAFDRTGMRDRVFAHKRRQLAIDRILHNLDEDHARVVPPTRSHRLAGAGLVEVLRARPAALMQLAMASLVLCLLVLPYLTGDKFMSDDGSSGRSVAAVANTYPWDVRMGRFITPPSAGDRFSLSAQEAAEKNLYHVGVVSTQLDVAIVADDKTMVSAYLSYLDSVPEVSAEPELATLLRNSVAQLASDGDISDDSYQSVQRLLLSLADGQNVSQWLKLGRNTESLRLALLLSAESGDSGIIRQLLPWLRWPSEQQLPNASPRLRGIVTDVSAVVGSGGELSRLQQRYLLDQIELINVLLR